MGVGIASDQNVSDIAAIAIGELQIKDGEINGLTLQKHIGFLETCRLEDIRDFCERSHNLAQQVQENLLVFNN